MEGRGARILAVGGIVVTLGAAGASLAFPSSRNLGFLLLGAAGAAVIVWVVYEVRHRHSPPNFAERCADLAGEIRGFLRERRLDEPQHEFAPQSLSSDARHLHFEKQTAKLLSHSSETRSRYEARFKDRALALYAEAKRRGLVRDPEQLDAWFAHAINPLAMEEVATALGNFANAAR